ncbi:hypothetical protein L3Q82_021855, partial [Scortum barcoo]
GTRAQSANKNGKKADSGSSSGSFFTWFIVLALLGVWTSVAVVYFDLVDYQGVLDKAKGFQINLSEALQAIAIVVLICATVFGRMKVQTEIPVPRFMRRERTKAGTRGTRFLRGMRTASLGLKRCQFASSRVLSEFEHGRHPITIHIVNWWYTKQCCCSSIPETSRTKDVGLKLRETLKQQLAIIHERVEAKKLAKLALAEVRQLLAKEEEDKELDLGRKEITARVKERVAARLKEEEEKLEKEEMEKALEKLRKGKAEHMDEKKEEEVKEEKEGEKKLKKGEKEEKSEKKVEGEGKKAQEEDKRRGKESAKEKKKKSKAEKSDRGGKK